MFSFAKKHIFVVVLGLLLMSNYVSAKTVVVNHPEVYVFDLLPSCVGDYCSLKIMDAPHPGQHQVLREHQILSSIIQEGFELDKSTFKSSYKVVREHREALAKELEEKIKESIKKILPEGVSLENMGRISSGNVPKDGYEIDVAWDDAKMYSRTISLPVNLVSKGVSFRRILVVCRFSYIATIPVAAVDIEPGTIIGSGDISYTSVKISGNRIPQITEVKDIVGKKARSKIARGNHFETRQLEDIPVVKRGDVMTIWSYQGQVRISTRGYARQDGVAGQRISVELPYMGRVVFAQVESDGSGVIR